MIRQYLRIKSQYQDSILFYRMGDFYEMFFDDAKVASRLLNIALTSRDKEKPDAVPLCGVPYHSAENYISRLIKQGHKVAVCEQFGNNRKGSKLVRREVVRVITPGTMISEGYLNEKRNNFLAAVNQAMEVTGLAFLDISTGDFVAMEMPDAREEEIIGRLADFDPSELVLPEETGDVIPSMYDKAGLPRPSLPRIDGYFFEPERARQILLEQFGTITLEPFGITNKSEAMLGAAGAVLHYALDTQKRDLEHIRKLTVIRPDSHLQMDAATQRNLELIKSAVHGGREGTLLNVLDKTLTPMGGRMLRQWILRPLTELKAIEERLDGVAELAEKNNIAEDLRRHLKSILDLERLMSRLSMGFAGPRDLLALKNSFLSLPEIRIILSETASTVFRKISDNLDPLDDLSSLILESIREDAPATLKDGGFIRPGYDPSLDEWLAVKQQGRRWISELEAAERKRTGISNLKIRYNRVFGYFIEVTKTNLKEVPDDYMRKQTLVGSERFTSSILSEYETKILEADEKSLSREHELFKIISDKILSRGEAVRNTCRALSELDVIQSMAKAAVTGNYCRPAVDESDIIDIREGRHPVVEAVNADEPFIPNDCFMNTSDNQMLIITGPNMAGKSTYMRQVALTVLMAQMGSFVPSAKARIGIVDRVFTRVGATDYLVRGQSTFMVEMTETALILNNATPKSLIVLDEIGRGTSTFDGLSIAWAVAEFLHDNPGTKARTLFATHYHQLSELSLTLQGVKNYSTSVKEWGDRIIFLRKIVEGGSDKSYGIQVARLAGLPVSVIERAKEIMSNLEEGELNSSGMPRLADHHHSINKVPAQMYLFGAHEEAVLERLKNIDIDQITPLEALNILNELLKSLKRK